MSCTLRGYGTRIYRCCSSSGRIQSPPQVAAFTPPDHMDRDAFERRWSRLRADATVLNRVIVVDEAVAGTIGSCGEAGERQVTYWIGRSYRGRGVATDALNAFLAVDRSRPLYAHVASDTAASRRVLEKCGFRVIATEQGFAEARSAESRNWCCGSTSLRLRPSSGEELSALPPRA